MFFNDKPEVNSYYTLQINIILNTITQYMVSYLILNYQFYKHHYLSFGINIGCIIFLIIVDIEQIIEKKIIDYQVYIVIVMKILRLLLFSFGDNYAKYALYTEFLSPFSLILSMAIYEIIFLIIFTIPFCFLKYNKSGEIIFVEFLEYLEGMKVFYSIIYFIFIFLYEAFLLIIVDRFSPSHIPLALIIYAFFRNIYNVIKNHINKKESNWIVYVNFLIYIILFIAAMIHNEIIIINKWGFNAKTKLFLDIKLNEEKLNSDENIINDDEDDESENSGDKSKDSIIIKELKYNK